MIDQNALCEKIRELYPGIGDYGLDLKTAYDQVQDIWVVYLKKDNHQS